MADRNSTHSTLRERIVEHAFVGDALRRLWQRGVVDVEVRTHRIDDEAQHLAIRVREDRRTEEQRRNRPGVAGFWIGRFERAVSHGITKL